MRAAGLLVLLALALGAQAFYEGSDVLVLTPANFKDKLRASPALVEFYAPW